ncbi:MULTISPECIES: hypothetical protein [Kordiimonas]|jgi:hypothetical protein|uniref:hypothetical protein n=1 Tax=Kordiimonas TaxID=288021 RepID=UPI00258037CC|nr:hypothetical protein [Kordiimonas sp. UBA4487]
MTDSTVTNGVNPEFRVGEVLSQTFSTYFGNFFKFLAVSFIGYVVIIGGVGLITGSGLMMSDRSGEISPFVAPGQFFLNFLLTMVAAAVIQASVTFGAVEHQAGRSATVLGMIKAGVRSAIPVVLATVVMSVLVFIGSIFLLVPGIIIWLMLSVTVPAIVSEKLGMADGLKRSQELTTGFKWQVFAAFLVVLIAIWLFQILLATVMVGAGASMLGSNGGSSILALVVTILSIAMGSLTYGLMGSTVAAVYTNLRAAKEGTSADEIAKVFA